MPEQEFYLMFGASSGIFGGKKALWIQTGRLERPSVSRRAVRRRSSQRLSASWLIWSWTCNAYSQIPAHAAISVLGPCAATPAAYALRLPDAL